MQITSNFDSGNIRVLDANDPTNIQLEIIKDHQSDFYQWFHFKLHNTIQFYCPFEYKISFG